MKKKRWFVWLFIIFSLLVVPNIIKGAVIPARSGVYVYDDAGLLSDAQKDSLSERLKERGKEAGCGLYVVTCNEPGGRTGDQYLEDFYDNGYDTGQIDVDAVLIYVDMKNRYVNVQAYGKTQEKISDRICDKIIDALYDDLHYGDYYSAFLTYADKVEDYMNYVPIYLRAWVQLLAALVIGGASVAGMAASSGGRMTVNADTYLDSRYSGIRAKRDEYVRTSVTKRKKPEVSSGGGGGGGHVSSGGHSHSSGGRNF